MLAGFAKLAERLAGFQESMDSRITALQESIDTRMDLRITKLQESIDTRMDSRITKLQDSIGARMDSLDQGLALVRGRIDNLEDQVGRQGRRLASIESFPSVPFREPKQLYGIEAESVSSPIKVRVGRTG